MGVASKVFVIGLDSMEKDLILQWASEGILPNFKKLLDRSAWGLIENPIGLVSGGTWSSFYNGVLPDRHGQYDAYDYFDTNTYRYTKYRKSELSYSPVWEVFSSQDKRVVVVDAPYTFLSENINGVHVMDWCSHVRLHDGPPHTWPVELAGTIERRFGRDPLGTDEGSPCDQMMPHTAREYTDFRDKLLERLKQKTALCQQMIVDEKWDFFLSVFSEPHCVGHHCWHIHDPHHALHDPAVAEAVGDPLKDVYVGVDKAVGDLLERIDSDTTVLLYCSFGMAPHYSGTDLLDQILMRLEGKSSMTSKAQVTKMLRQAWRNAPAGIRNALLPIRRNLWEPFYQRSIVPDRSTRRFFEMKTNNAVGGVRLNLVDRESHGIVQPGPEAEDLLRQLESDLRAMVNADTNEPLVQDVLRTDEIYHGEQRQRLPDLLVVWNRSAPIIRATSTKTGLVENDHQNVRTGDHKGLGLFLALGPLAIPGKLLRSVSVIDFAPTIAALLGVTLPGIDGQAIGEVLGWVQSQAQAAKSSMEASVT